MATKVNTKFVIILAASMVIVLGAAGFLASQILFKSADKLAAMGDAKLAEGDLENAISFYGRAVNKEPQNIELLETWIGLMEQYVPETRAQYVEMFRTDYTSGLRVAAVRKKTDVDAHHRYLGMLYDMNRLSTAGRPFHERLITETTTALATYEFGRSPDAESGTEPWEVLRRYRGLPRVAIMNLGLDLDDEEMNEALDDLQVALRVNPNDSRSLIAIADWHIRRAAMYAVDNRQNSRMETLQAGRDAIAAHAAANGSSTASELASLKIDKAFADSQLELSGLVERDALRAAQEELYAPLRVRLDQVTDAVVDWDKSDYVDALTINRLEFPLVQDSGAARTIRVLEGILEANPDDLLAIATLGRVLQRQPDRREEAIELLAGLEDLPIKPIGLEGNLQFGAVDNALFDRARAQLRLARTAKDEEAADFEERLSDADATIEAFRSRVAAEDLTLLRLRAERAFLFDEPQDAQILLAQYNSRIPNPDGEVLWWTGQLASNMNQIGRAREAFAVAAVASPEIPEIRLALGELEFRLNEFENALEIFEGVLDNFPNNSTAQRYSARLNQILGFERVDDPVDQLLLDAARIVRGNSAGPGDRTEAIELLMDDYEANNRDPRLAQTIAGYYLELDRIPEARGVIESSLERHDNDDLRGLAEVLDNPDRVEVQAQMALRGEENAQKYLRAHLIYRRAGRVEQASRMLDDAIRLDPLAPPIVEAQFIRAVQRGEQDSYAEAQQIVDVATSNNIDQVQGKSYQSRLAYSRGNIDLSINLLREIVEQGSAPAPIYRLLGNQLVVKGELAQAAEAYRDSLEVMPSQPSVIVSYLQALVQNGQPEIALTEAREFQNQGSSDTTFVNLWLTLEARFGDKELAQQRREERLQRDPDDRLNRNALARIYMEDRRWNASGALIDGLRSEDDSIGLLELKALWHAAQGRVDDARSEYIAKITELSPDDTQQRLALYTSLARFLSTQNLPSQAVNALLEIRELQNRDTLNIDRMLGDVYAQAGDTESALTIYRGIVAADADTEEELFQKRSLDMLLRLGRLDEGREIIARARESRPQDLVYMLQDAEFSRLMADRSLVEGDAAAAAVHNREALSKLDNTVATHPGAEAGYLKRAELQLSMSVRSNSPAERETLERDALRNLDEAVRINPRQWNARQLRAQTYYTQGRIDEAIEEFRVALQLQPEMHNLRARLMTELLGLERVNDALLLATDAIESTPGNRQLIMRMGRVFADRGLWRPAATVFGLGWQTTREQGFGSIYIDSLLNQEPPQVALARDMLVELRNEDFPINRDPALLILQAVVVQELNSESEARELMIRSFEACDPGNPNHYQVWAQNLPRILTTPGERTQLLEQMINAYSNDAERSSWASLLLTQMLMEDPARVNDGIERLTAIAQNPDSTPDQSLRAYLQLGSHFGESNPTRAIETWREGLERLRGEEGSWRLVNNIAFLMIGQGEYESALQMAQEAVELAGPSEAEPLDTLGWAYTKLNRFEEAEETLGAAGEVASSLAQAYAILYHQIQCAVAQNDTEKARVRCQRFLRQMRGSPNLAEEFATEAAEVQALLDRL